ncbi:glutamate racemase [Roseateles koreensis]|uniref:Glutamate racemase n=1 Tax=Roseateles koreensis TaxID=2987526 RepID=A0ABT5KL39_9BURK|nr:glutamate racemase [Roseateles koreensis]MDC8783633.1 glutamate racemase [Roseateles koreensis]
MNAVFTTIPLALRAASARIGVFDSGVGGLTVLRELHRVLPGVPMHYVADNGHAPYGQRSPEFIIERSLALTDYLTSQGTRVLVVACNTATAQAVAALRQRWPELPIVGIEPGIKPAVAASRNGRIGVMATPSTIASARYQSLIERHAPTVQVFSQACPGLVNLIERGELDSPALHRLLQTLCAPLIDAGVDTVLMGCTHYPLVQAQLQSHFGGGVQLLNIETAVAQQAARLWAAKSPVTPPPTYSIENPVDRQPVLLEATGDATQLARFQNFVQEVMGWHSASVQALRR